MGYLVISRQQDFQLLSPSHVLAPHDLSLMQIEQLVEQVVIAVAVVVVAVAVAVARAGFVVACLVLGVEYHSTAQLQGL